MDAQAFKSIINGFPLDGMKVVIDLYDLEFLGVVHDVVRFRRKSTGEIMEVHIGLISHVYLPDAQVGGDIEAIRKAVEQVGELSIHGSIGKN